MPTAINWTPELEQSVVDWIASGKTLRDFGRQEGNPSHDAVYDHEKLFPDFKQRIASAREIGYDVIAEESLEIIDEKPTCMVPDPDGGMSERIDSAGVQRNFRRAEHRLKLLAKWNPKKYGERVQQEVSGELTVKRVVADI